MKRSRRCMNLNSIACSPDNALSEMSKLKQVKEEICEEVGMHSQDHLPQKKTPMFDLNVKDCSDMFHGLQDSSEVNELGKRLTQVNCESPQYAMTGNHSVEGSDDSDCQIFLEASAIPLTPSVFLDVKKEHYDDGEIAQTPVEEVKSSITSAPVLSQAQLVSHIPSSSMHDPPALLQFQLRSDTPGDSKCKSHVSTAKSVMIKSEKQGSSMDGTSLSRLVDISQSESREILINDLLSTADTQRSGKNGSKPIVGLVSDQPSRRISNAHATRGRASSVPPKPVLARNFKPPSKRTCPCVSSLITSSNPLASLNPVGFQSPLPPDQIKCRQSRSKVFVKTRQPDVIDPVYALKWSPATPPHIGQKVGQGSIYPMPNQMPMPTYAQAQPNPNNNFPISLYSFTGIPVKDVDYMREHGEEKLRFPNFPFSLSLSHPHPPAPSSISRYPYSWLNQKPYLREIRPKPPAPIKPKSRYLKQCKYYKQSTGCRKGSNCSYVHGVVTHWPPKELEKEFRKATN